MEPALTPTKRGRPRGRNRVPLKPRWQPQTLSPRQLRVLCLVSTGEFSNSQVAEFTGYSAQQISNIRSSKMGMEFLAAVRSRMVREMGTGVSDEIVGHTREALDVVASLMRFADSHSVQLSAAKDLLDRGGFRARERHEHVVAQIPLHVLENLRVALAESRAEPPVLEEIENSAASLRGWTATSERE